MRFSRPDIPGVDQVHMVAAQPTRIYAGPETALTANFLRDGAVDGWATCSVTITGHFVSLN